MGTDLSTLALLLGTEFTPALGGSVVFIEDDAGDIRALVIGRFPRASNVTRELLHAVVRTKPQLGAVPVVANLDFGHTTPLLTLPVGGAVRVEVEGGQARITLLEH